MEQKDIARLFDQAEEELAPTFAKLDAIERKNLARVLDAFRAQRIAAHHFSGTSGYGYDDIGRDALEKVFAQVFGAQDALVRPSIASGTHALAICLFGLLRPGQTLLAVTGRPYDTLESVIGLNPNEHGQGSLKDLGVGYAQVELNGAQIDFAALETALQDKTVKLCHLQRSRGYAWRAALSVEQIGQAAAFIHERRPDVAVMVDNCYGEFVEEREPCHVGADIVAGSLIKNPGGGIAPTGGYIAGRADLIERCAYRLTSPGIGREVGSYAAGYGPFYQGLFLAPHVVAQAVRGSALAGAVFEKLGYAVSPGPKDRRSDIIQAIRFEKEEALVRFCQAIQYASPVDSYVTPEPWAMPGYQDKVIMAAGTFVAGASIELSADAPIRPPYIGYLQGGLSYTHVRLALQEAVERILRT